MLFCDWPVRNYKGDGWRLGHVRNPSDILLGERVRLSTRCSSQKKFHTQQREIHGETLLFEKPQRV